MLLKSLILTVLLLHPATMKADEPTPHMFAVVMSDTLLASPDIFKMKAEYSYNIQDNYYLSLSSSLAYNSSYLGYSLRSGFAWYFHYDEKTQHKGGFLQINPSFHQWFSNTEEFNQTGSVALEAGYRSHYKNITGGIRFGVDVPFNLSYLVAESRKGHELLQIVIQPPLYISVDVGIVF